MKTEKRLTMALSVLVALMMLAVPLASSSNLFVDGGQTNSNGDAPSLGADESVGGVEITDIKIIDDKYSYENYLPETYVKQYPWNDSSDFGLPWMIVYFTVDGKLTGEASFEVQKDGTKIDSANISKVSLKTGSTNYYMMFHLGTGANGADQLKLAEDKQKGTYTVKVSVGTDDKNYATADYSYATNAYNVDFILNDIGGAISLNETEINLPTDELNKVSWYLTEDKNIRAVVVGPNVTIEYLISKLAAKDVIAKEGYTLDVWKDSTNLSYQNTTNLPNVQNVIAGDMTVTANWALIDDKYAQLAINVAGDIKTDKTFVKAFILNKDGKIAFVEKNASIANKTNALITSLPGISTKGYDVVNERNEEIYTMKVTSSNGNEVKNETVLSVDDSLTVTYTMNTTLYQKITVTSDMFEEDVVLFAPAADDFTYIQIFKALQKYDGSNSELFGIKQSSSYSTDKSYVTSDNYYRVIGFDGIKGNLESNKNASNAVTLDVSLNEYKVMFMVNGKFEVVSVAYGENPLDKCTLISGMTVDHWVTYKVVNDKYEFSTFNFTTSGIASIEDSAAKAEDKSKVVETFVACFYPDSQTGYAVFNAVGVAGDDNSNAYFGSKDVTEIIVTGKVGDSIPKADAPSSSKDHWLFFGWNTTQTWNDTTNKKDTFIKDTTVTYNAVWNDYECAITFYDGSNVVGVFYCDKKSSIASIADIDSAIVGIEYDGKLYSKSALNTITSGSTNVYVDPDAAKAYTDAYKKILFPAKDGYDIEQWNDADGNAMIAVKELKTSPISYEVSKVNIKEIKSDISLYAKFDPREYTIAYNSAIAAYPNPMSQQGFVDESLKLLGDATFNNEGYKLVSWNTRADGEGTKYDLGSDFTLNGEQYEDLKNGEITLYAIWEKVGSSSGDNNEGNNDSNTDTYLLAGILIVIIVLIIVVAVVLRKKQ